MSAKQFYLDEIKAACSQYGTYEHTMDVINAAILAHRDEEMEEMVESLRACRHHSRMDSARADQLDEQVKFIQSDLKKIQGMLDECLDANSDLTADLAAERAKPRLEWVDESVMATWPRHSCVARRWINDHANPRIGNQWAIHTRDEDRFKFQYLLLWSPPVPVKGCETCRSYDPGTVDGVPQCGKTGLQAHYGAGKSCQVWEGKESK